MTKIALPLALELELPVTTWLDDETFYSLCCRFHSVASNATAGRTAQQLFGHSRLGTQHDFASRIDVFAQRTYGLFGTAEAIIRTHTILPFFLPWRTPSDASYLIQTLAKGRAGPIKSHLGLPASRVRAHHPLKACRRCMAYDIRQHGVAYWHLSHQLPGVWTCPTHGDLLLESTRKATHVGRFLWHLPHEGEFYPQTLPDESTHQFLHALTEAAVAAFGLPPHTHIDLARLAEIFRRGLCECGLLRGKTQTALEAAAWSYLQLARRVQPITTDIRLPMNLGEVKQSLAQRLSHPQRTSHPTSQLLIVIWLFGHWSAFWHAYQHMNQHGQCEIDDPAGHKTGRDTSSDPRKRELLHLVHDKEFTISRAANAVGIAVQTAQAWACAEGMIIDRRPQIAASNMSAIIKDLRKGLGITCLAKKHGVSPSIITRVLHTESGLHDAWRQARYTRRQNIARCTWAKTIESHPGIISSTLRAIVPATYSWLYRNDRQWLRTSLSNVPIYARSNGKSINWQKRDEHLSHLVGTVIQELLTTQPSGKPISLQQLYLAAPALKPYLGKRDRLPLTRQAIELARIGDFHKFKRTTVK